MMIIRGTNRTRRRADSHADGGHWPRSFLLAAQRGCPVTHGTQEYSDRVSDQTAEQPDQVGRKG
jgi:hypothetical protein